jgi:hypothetical protein
MKLNRETKPGTDTQRPELHTIGLFALLARKAAAAVTIELQAKGLNAHMKLHGTGPQFAVIIEEAE